MSTPDLRAIRARVEAATPGPWTEWQDGNQYIDPPREYSSGGPRHVVAAVIVKGLPRAWNPWWVGHKEPEANHRAHGESRFKAEDAAFIAHAREDVPALLTLVEQLTAERDEARAARAQEADKRARRALHLVEVNTVIAGRLAAERDAAVIATDAQWARALGPLLPRDFMNARLSERLSHDERVAVYVEGVRELVGRVEAERHAHDIAAQAAAKALDERDAARAEAAWLREAPMLIRGHEPGCARAVSDATSHARLGDAVCTCALSATTSAAGWLEEHDRKVRREAEQAFYGGLALSFGVDFEVSSVGSSVVEKIRVALRAAALEEAAQLVVARGFQIPSLAKLADQIRCLATPPAAEWEGPHQCATCGRDGVSCKSDGVVWTCAECVPAAGEGK